MVKIIPQQILTTRWKKPLHSPKCPILPFHWDGRFLPYPFNATWKTLTCFNFPSRGVKIGEKYVPTYFSVWLWIVTLFNTPKSEMSLKVLMFIGNRILISTWKCWIWISKNESILRTTAWKGCWLLFYPKLCEIISVRKIPTILLDKCKRMT